MASLLALATTLLFLAGPPPEMTITIDALPPSVVTTVPRSGDPAVDPTTSEIRVTFSKDMITDRMWSCVQISNESYPKVTGEPRYLDDKRTFVLPVQLQPGHVYVIWFNHGQYDSFRDTYQNPAVPYLLVFETKGKPGV